MPNLHIIAVVSSDALEECKVVVTSCGYDDPFPNDPIAKVQIVGPATTQNLVVKFDGEICGGVLEENASGEFPQQKQLENLLPNFAGSLPPILPKTSPT